MKEGRKHSYMQMKWAQLPITDRKLLAVYKSAVKSLTAYACPLFLEKAIEAMLKIAHLSLSYGKR